MKKVKAENANRNRIISPLVSIIIPVYNGSCFISECIESVLAQSYSNIEIIIIDDGSTDNTSEICKKYAADDNRIIFLQQTNMGQGEARNRGIAMSKGKWISFVDSDDIIHPSMVETLINNAFKYNVPISEGGFIEFYDNPEEVDEQKDSVCEYIVVNEDHILNEKFNCWVIWGKVIRRDICKSIPFTRGKIFEDNAVILSWLHEAGAVAYTNSILYYYRDNPSGTTKTAFNKKQLDFLWALEERIEFCLKNDYRKLLESTLLSYLDSSQRMSSKVQRELKEPSLARSIKKRALHITLKKWKTVPHKIRILRGMIKLSFKR